MVKKKLREFFVKLRINSSNNQISFYLPRRTLTKEEKDILEKSFKNSKPIKLFISIK